MQYYVESGDLQAIIDADKWQQAAEIALRNVDGVVNLAVVICVSTTGFDGSGMGGGWIDTQSLIKKIEADEIKPDVVINGSS